MKRSGRGTIATTRAAPLRRVRALPVPPLGEAAVARLAVHGGAKLQPVEQGEPVVAHFADDTHLVAVLEVRADARQVDAAPGSRAPRAPLADRCPRASGAAASLNAPPARITSRRTSTRFKAAMGRAGGAGRGSAP